MDINFTNKVVLVTGASAGIGEAISLLFAKCGAQLVLVGRNEENLLEVAGRCETERGLKPVTIVADLSTDDGCDKTVKETLDKCKRLDVLVNNAGISARTCLLETDMAIFDQVFNLDVRGVYNLTRQLVPALIETKGNIVNISSIAATMVVVGNLPYAMAKAALDHFTRVTALELAPKGVRVNAVSPGVTVSKIVQRMTGYTDEQYQIWLEKTAHLIPMGQVCVGEDIAKTVVHLASDHSRLTTGAIVPIDGGAQFLGATSIIKEQMKSAN